MKAASTISPRKSGFFCTLPYTVIEPAGSESRAEPASMVRSRTSFETTAGSHWQTR